MPIITISLGKGTSREHREQIAQSVHRAMNDVPRTPADDFFAITQELDPEEVAPENWWLYGREIDPATGTDARMSQGVQTHAPR